MASLRKRRNKYFARVIVQLGNNRNTEIQINLNTHRKDVADLRMDFIKVHEDAIRKGRIKRSQFKDLFPWKNSEGTSTIKEMRLKDIIPKYLKYRLNKVKS